MKKRQYRKLQKRLAYLVKELNAVSIEVENLARLTRDLDPRLGAESIHDTLRRLTRAPGHEWHLASGSSTRSDHD